MQSHLTNNCIIIYGVGGNALEGVGVLLGLGLSKQQALVYFALLKAGRDSKVRPLADAAGVPRQDAYELLLKLQHMRLVRQNLTFSSIYTAAPFVEATKILFKHRAKELTLMSQKTETLTSQLSQPHPTPAPVPCFGTVFEAEGGRHYLKAIAEAQGSIEGVFSWVRFRQFCSRFEAELRAALKRDVALRFVTEKPCGHCLPRWIGSLPKYRFELRTLLNPPDAAVVLFDAKQAAIAFDGDVCITKGIDLWTAHPAVTAACEAYFYRVWTNAQRQAGS